MKEPKWTPFKVLTLKMDPMESGRFTVFSKNAPFGKPGILNGFRGPRPSFGLTPGSTDLGATLGNIRNTCEVPEGRSCFFVQQHRSDVEKI